jgi:hypothetical protein
VLLPLAEAVVDDCDSHVGGAPLVQDTEALLREYVALFVVKTVEQ